jgi:hypothetical protein
MGVGRKAVVLGSVCDLRRVIAERLASAGHRVTQLEAGAATAELDAEILVHLDASLAPSPGLVDPAPPFLEARASFGVIERAARSMELVGFGRIVHLRAAQATTASSSAVAAMATFELAGTLAVLEETARRLAPLGITLNVVTLTTSSVVPTQRKATSDEVAALVEMLCDDQAGFITAQSFSMVIGLA